ncbi:hypothetical protein KP509_02G047300 [Ceratopteris richardii]|uniref:non-specific serine/threonine protein kinase n=1 Tax=Ceratopteris richardii TaxID=49495 RepID=A0A8T2VCL2_CERRI|nr:hypothetical protein KP509_02G047300 [Ceratopteris richardii]
MNFYGQWRLLSFSRPADLLLLYCVIFSSLWWTGESDTSQDDVNALQAMLNSWGPRSSYILKWHGDDPCGSKWIGIKCDDSSPQRVTSIELSGLGLSGDIPPDISLLTELRTLDLSYNRLTGSIPTQIGELSHLSKLYLQYNYLNGGIPPEIGNIKNLSYISLNGNSLKGSIPHEIGLLENLFWLDLAKNDLSGGLPYSGDGGSSKNVGLDNLTKANHFHLNNNSFSGPIPEALCHERMSLIHLILDSNLLTGNIPSGLGLCGNLLIMKLNNNQLGGTIPQEISLLTNLTELQLHDNQLVGPLPDLSNFTNLALLDVSNNQLNMEFPLWMNSLRSLTDLDMSSASVSGTISASFFELPFLTAVKLANNEINGTLDLSMDTSQLMLLSMENNKIDSFTTAKYPPSVIRLFGNPVCETSKSTLSGELCQTNSSSSVSTYGQGNCSNTCPSGYQVYPAECSCAIPYEGVLIYRAPSFTQLINQTVLSVLASALAENLSVQRTQVVIKSAEFNAQNQLTVEIAVFPNGAEIRWSRDDFLKMSSILGRDGVAPDGFGPPMFQQSSFDYIGSDTNGNTLSTVAIIGICIGSAALASIIIGVTCFVCLRKDKKNNKAAELSNPFGAWNTDWRDNDSAPKLKGARYFTFAELKKASNNFSESNEIGSGGYGKVYRGILTDGQQVAIKRAQTNSMQGAPEFKNEIELLSRVHHKNVVGLVGFCCDQGEQMLVYEYMAGGNLRDCLTGRSRIKLDWRRRIMIALGSARGITYLHELVSPPIIHRDIKSTNILLDEKKIAKVADFGLSKIAPEQDSRNQHVSTQVKGTLGYLDPEYYTTQQLTEKSDVYSFGVVLLELLTARTPIEHGKYVVKKVKEAVDKGGISAIRSMLDPRIKEESGIELNSFLHIALSCVEDTASARPSMGEVVKQLEEMVGHDYPESGSSNVDTPPKGVPARHLYGSDSEYMHTSRDSSDPSFPTSNIALSFGSR